MIVHFNNLLQNVTTLVQIIANNENARVITNFDMCVINKKYD